MILLIFESASLFLLEPVTYEHFLNKELKEKAREGITPDMVAIGDSRVMMGLIPSVIEENIKTVDCVLNAGTGSQPIWGSYYYLKDLLEKYDIKYAVVGINYAAFANEKKRMPKRDVLIMDRIESATIKLDYMMNILESMEYPLLLKSYRYRDGASHAFKNIKDKSTSEYRRGKDVRKESYYKDMGYVYTKEKGDRRAGMYEAREWDGQNVSPLAIEYLDKIVKLCKDNKVGLYLTALPFTYSSVHRLDSYQECFDFFQTFANKRGVPFYDLNLIKDRIEVLPDGLFDDMEHLGGKGAEVISSLYGDIIAADIEGRDTSMYFYSSVKELKNDMSGVVACDFRTEPLENSKDRIIYADSIYEKGIEVEYEYWVSPADGLDQWIKLKDYSAESECILPEEYLEKKVKILVNCREKGSNRPWDMQREKIRTPDMK